MNPADRECLERLQAGDQAALAELFDRYAALMHPLALRILGNAAQADEVLLEVWTLVLRRAVRFEPSRGVASWLVSLVRTRSFEHRRNGWVQGAVVPSSGEDGPLEVSAERVDLADRATEVFANCDESERRVLELAFYEGLTQSEISSRLGASLSDVRNWTLKGLDRLQAVTPRQEAA